MKKLINIAVSFVIGVFALSCSPNNATKKEKPPQVDAGTSPTSESTDAGKPTTIPVKPSSCPAGMALVEGTYYLSLTHKCLRSFGTEKGNQEWYNHCVSFKEGVVERGTKDEDISFRILTHGLRAEKGNEVTDDSWIAKALIGKKSGERALGCLINPSGQRRSDRLIQAGDLVSLTCPAAMPIRVCIDKYEYPNKPGEPPQNFIGMHEGEAACAAEGKRLCAEHEWTMACEGEEALPYPYGWERDNNACNTSRCAAVCPSKPESLRTCESIGLIPAVRGCDPLPAKDRVDCVRRAKEDLRKRCATEVGQAFDNGFCWIYDEAEQAAVTRPKCPQPAKWMNDGERRSKEIADAELARLNAATGIPGTTYLHPSGARQQCVSPYGVYDMVGNLGEWVQCFDQCEAYPSNGKGGHFLGNVRNRCRPVTTGHGPYFKMHSIGTRCCSDPTD